MKRLLSIKEVYVRWIGIPILTLIMTLVYPLEDGESWVHQVFVAFTFTAIYWNGAVMIFMYFRRRFPEIRETPKRLTITFLSLIIFMAVSDPFLCVLFNFKSLEVAFSVENIMFNSTVNIIAALVVGSIYENVYFFELWKKSIWMNEALRNQQIRTQFEVLQNQMSPHFLFNSLNTLSTLIAEDSKVAIEFTERLSEVYRYILQNRDRELVRLSEEIEFARNYLFLLKIRYPQNLSAEFNVPDKYLGQNIAPLTIQILIENAIKHNTISKSHPLHVSIYVEGSDIIVKNNLQKKNVIEKSTKTGLANIKNRYAYFGKESIGIRSSEQDWIVSIPLLTISGESERLMRPSL